MKRFWLVLRWISFVGMLIFAAYAVVHAEQAEYTPTELQSLRLQLKQRDAQLAQKDFFIAQQNMNAALQALNSEAEKVKAANGWPESVQFNQATLVFSEALKNTRPLSEGMGEGAPPIPAPKGSNR